MKVTVAKIISKNPSSVCKKMRRDWFEMLFLDNEL
jgi:hypothetical protein